MTMDNICDKVSQLKGRYREKEPASLIRAMDVLLLSQPLGTHKTACKGFFMTQSRVRVITVNSDLPDELRRIILAHELGHAVLHGGRTGVKAFHDFQLFDETSRYEYEANIFAAELLMSDEDVLELLNDDISFFAAAGCLGVPPELLDFKFRILKRKGYKVIDPPLGASSRFLKDFSKLSSL